MFNNFIKNVTGDFEIEFGNGNNHLVNLLFLRANQKQCKHQYLDGGLTKNDRTATFTALKIYREGSEFGPVRELLQLNRIILFML